MSGAISLLSYALVAAFGIFLSAGFSGVAVRRETFPRLALFTVGALAVQFLCFTFLGLKYTRWVYPLILHLPLAVFLAAGCKRPLAVAVVSIFLSYLCCQTPRWIAAITYVFTDAPVYHDLLHCFAICAVYMLLHSYVVKPIQKVMTYSPRSVWGLGLLPLLYYVFDYLTTVYTDVLYSGNPYVVQIMPSLMSAGYLVFVLFYHARVEEQETAKQEQYLLSLQLRRSQAEYAALLQMQDQANRYHHDMRHHTALLLNYAESGSVQQIKSYLLEIQQNLDSVVCRHFCGHPVVDLLLSHFESKASGAGVQLKVHAQLPPSLPFKDTELCSLLSNGLENAIAAAALMDRMEDRTVTVTISVRQRNLLLSIRNPYQGDVTIADGIPATAQSGHGLGTRSIVSIAHRYGGLAHFSAVDGIFLLRVTLPMD